MAIETTCGGCGKQLSVGDEHAGRRARCPACGQIYTIPSPTSPNAGPPDLPSVPQTPVNDSFADTSVGSSALPPDPSLTSPATNNAIPSLPNAGSAAANTDQYWMRSTEGNEYGPVDRSTLTRWFNEGRVGPGYLIRQSETGDWQVADAFKPSAQVSSFSNPANPYSVAPASPAAPTYGQMYPKPDQSGLVLAFGILSWFICPIFGVVAWIMGNSGLNDIRLGLVDPANKGLMQAGYYLGMVNVILYILCGGGYFLFIAMMVLLGAMN